MELRYYQKEAIDAVLNEFLLVGHNSTLLEMATGCGKTIIFAELIKHFIKGGNRKVLVLAHREELIQQAVDKITYATGLTWFDIQVEMGKNYAPIISPVVVASVQSLKGHRLKYFPPEHFGLVIVDEAHHSVANNYVKILRHFTGAKILGVSATLDRLDKKGLGELYDSIAYTYEITDGIRDGFLAPIRSRMVVIKSLDTSDLRTTMGDFRESDLEKQLINRPSLWETANPIIELSGDRRTLVFGVSIAHARDLAQVINSAKPNSADFLSSEDSPERRHRVLKSFKEGKIQYLCNCLLFTEGIDLPFVSCVACARPTQSRALYSQMVGRGTRIHPGKEDLLVIDFTDNAHNHKLICSVDVLDGALSEKERSNAKRKMEDETVNIEETIKEAKIGEDVEQEKEKARSEVSVTFQIREIDPFSIIGLHLHTPRFGGLAPTDKQKSYLEKHGLWRDTLTRRQASLTCAKIVERNRMGQCSPKMARVLAKYGFDPNISMAQGKALLDEIGKAGWPNNLPEHLKQSAAYIGAEFLENVQSCDNAVVKKDLDKIIGIDNARS
jgi:superfamily II DNA or RNA helicase